MQNFCNFLFPHKCLPQILSFLLVYPFLEYCKFIKKAIITFALASTLLIIFIEEYFKQHRGIYAKKIDIQNVSKSTYRQPSKQFLPMFRIIINMYLLVNFFIETLFPRTLRKLHRIKSLPLVQDHKISWIHIMIVKKINKKIDKYAINQETQRESGPKDIESTNIVATL